MDTRRIYEPMFEDQTYEKILERNLDRIPNEFDKREGSVIFDAIAPMALEVSILYSYLDFLFKNAFGDTANRYWLIQRAKERGIEPHPATPSIVIGKFNVELPIGEKFSHEDLYFDVIKFAGEKEGLFYYEMQCSTPGIVGNIRKGRLTPNRAIRDLKVAEIDNLAVPGENEEDTETFRDRYFETINSNAYGGNIDDYRIKVKAIEGVGSVKIIPVWNGGGTVKVIITDPENKGATKELVERVQEALDPVPFNQKGVGIAPIGHLVTVVSANEKVININAEIMKETGSDIEEIKKDIKRDIEDYFKLERERWSRKSKEKDEIYIENDIRLAKIMSIVLNTKGVVDYKNIKFDSNEKIMVLAEEEIPVLGELKITEVVI